MLGVFVGVKYRYNLHHCQIKTYLFVRMLYALPKKMIAELAKYGFGWIMAGLDWAAGVAEVFGQVWLIGL